MHFRPKKLNGAQLGVAVVEFLFAAPAFFVLVFFVIEIALVWNDRHIMRLAAYRAARAVVKTRATQSVAQGLCWSDGNGGPEDDNSKDVHVHARRAAAKIMATVTPSSSQVLSMFRVPNHSPAATNSFDDAITESTERSFGSTLEGAANNPYVHAVARMMRGLPGAWIFTDLSCENVVYPATASSNETNGVEIKLLYHRPAKMPFVGTLMWVLKRVVDFGRFAGVGDDGTRGSLRVNPLNYGLETSPDVHSAEAQGALEHVREMVADKAEELGERLSKKISESKMEFPTPVTNIGGNLPQVFGDAANATFDRGVEALESWRGQELVNWVADRSLEMLLSMPDEIKTIPVTVTVRIPNHTSVYVNSGMPWNNVTWGVGSFTAQGDNNMEKLARGIGALLDQDTKLFDHVDKLPYIPAENQEKDVPL